MDAQNDTTPLSRSELLKIFEEAIFPAVHKLQARLVSLEKRTYTYEGTHSAGAVYEAGKMVSHDGKLWKAHYKTASLPGESKAWELLGKDVA